MIDFLRNLLAPVPAGSPDPEPAVAVAALLAEAAQADGFAPDAGEHAAADRFLMGLFDLDAGAAADLRRRGEAARAASSDLVRFTRVVKTALDADQRAGLMQALWAVALADGVRDPHEDALLRKLAPLIALTDHESAAARRRAAAE